MRPRYNFPSLRSALFACGISVLALGCAGTTGSAAAPQTARTTVDLSEARALAPQAAAHADELNKRAESLRDSGQTEEAKAVTDRSRIAYQRLQVQARQIASAKREADANGRQVAPRQQLAELERHQEQIEAQTRALELKLEVAHEAEPREPLRANSPKRDAARSQAGKAIAQEAALLCEAARLLEPDRPSLTASLAQARELLEASPKVSPATLLTRALNARVQCLTELSQIRRTEASPSTGSAADTLLDQLARAFPGALVFRDDRGVVVSASVFQTGPGTTGRLSPSGNTLVQQLADVARANPHAPLLVVTRGSPRKNETAPATADEKRAELLRTALREAGVSDANVQLSGAYSAVPQLSSQGKERSDSVEFVFVLRRL